MTGKMPEAWQLVVVSENITDALVRLFDSWDCDLVPGPNDQEDDLPWYIVAPRNMGVNQ